MKNVLVYFYAFRNLGDDLFIKILLDRYPNFHFKIIAPFSYEKLFRNYKNLSIISPKFSIVSRVIFKLLFYLNKKLADTYLYNIKKKQYRKNLKEVDALIYVGGSLFIQRGSKLNSRDYLFKFLAEEIKVPRLILGTNFGPFTTEEYLTLYTKVFKQFDDICFREKFSKELFQSVNNTRCEYDIVFQMDVDNRSELKIKNSYGFSVIDLEKRESLHSYDDRYLNLISESIREIIDNGGVVYLFSFCRLEGDEKMIAKILNSLSEQYKESIKTILYEDDIESFLSIYKKMEYMFCTRFHSLILSILFNQKFLPVIYSNKILNVLNDLGFQGDILHIDDQGLSIEGSRIMSYFHNKNNQIDLTKEVIDSSKRQFEVLDSILSKEKKY